MFWNRAPRYSRGITDSPKSNGACRSGRASGSETLPRIGRTAAQDGGGRAALKFGTREPAPPRFRALCRTRCDRGHRPDPGRIQGAPRQADGRAFGAAAGRGTGVAGSSGVGVKQGRSFFAPPGVRKSAWKLTCSVGSSDQAGPHKLGHQGIGKTGHRVPFRRWRQNGCLESASSSVRAHLWLVTHAAPARRSHFRVSGLTSTGRDADGHKWKSPGVEFPGFPMTVRAG